MALTTDLVSYYKADSDGSFPDAHGSNDGTINGASYTASGLINGAQSLDGSNDYISLPFSGSDFGTAFSINIWFKKDTTWGNAGESNFFEHLDYGSTTGLVIGYVVSGKPNAVIHDGTSWLFLAPSSAPSVDEYHMYTFTKDSSNNVTYYIDGSSVDSGTKNLRTDIDSTAIGRYAAAYVNGDVDEVGIWSRELTSAEVTELYNSGSGLAYPFVDAPDWTKCVAYYKLEDTADVTGNYDLTNDGATSGATGIISNAYTFVTNDWMYNSSTLGITDYPFTFNAWIKTAATAGTIMDFADTGSDVYYLNMRVADDGGTGYLCLVRRDSTSDIYIGSIAVDDDDWHMVTGVFTSATNAEIFVDGNSAGTATTSKTFNAAIDRFNIGVNGRSSKTNYFDGEIDEVSVFNVALSTDEIAFLYNGGSPGSDQQYPPLLSKIHSYWKLDESSGDAIDSVGSNDLTLAGPTQGATGKINTAYSFDGNNDYLYKNNVTFTWSAFTFAAWIYWDGSTADNRHIVFWSDTNDGFDVFIRPASSSKIRFNLEVDNGIHDIHTDSACPSGEWVHYVATWDGTNLYSYVNGTQQAETEAHTGTFNATANFGIGRNMVSDNYFDGDIDEIGIWSRALSSDEVTALYNSGTGLSYPFYTTVGATGTNFQINIGDTWKDVSAMKINIGDTWKSVESVKINIGDTWKTVF